MNPVRILMVEDNDPGAYLVRTALRSAQIDFELTHAKDGLTALAMLDDASAKSSRSDLPGFEPATDRRVRIVDGHATASGLG